MWTPVRRRILGEGTDESPKYTRLIDLVRALRDDSEEKAFCSFDKEFVRITSEPNEYDPCGKNGLTLFECDENDFVECALEALGVTMTP